MARSRLGDGAVKKLKAWPRLPVSRHAVMTVSALGPISVFPRVVTEFGRVAQLLLVDVGAKTTNRLVIGEGTPRDRIVAMTEAQEAAKTHDRIRDAARGLVDDEVIDLADVLSVLSVDFRPVDILA